MQLDNQLTDSLRTLLRKSASRPSSPEGWRRQSQLSKGSSQKLHAPNPSRCGAGSVRHIRAGSAANSPMLQPRERPPTKARNDSSGSVSHSRENSIEVRRSHDSKMVIAPGEDSETDSDAGEAQVTAEEGLQHSARLLQRCGLSLSHVDSQREARQDNGDPGQLCRPPRGRRKRGWFWTRPDGCGHHGAA